jgi:hypothetical protein
MKPTAQQIEQVVADFGMLRFFPSGESERLAIMRLLRTMVGTSDELLWLRDAMMNHVGEWRGPAELRGVYCAYGVMTGAVLRPGGWKPADGIRAESSTPGYTQQDRNSKYIELESQQTAGFLPSESISGKFASGAEMKHLPLQPGEIAKNDRLLRRVEYTACNFKAIPRPTGEDRAASERLLGNLERLA